MLLDTLIIYGGVTIHHITYLFKTLLATEKVLLNFRQTLTSSSLTRNNKNNDIKLNSLRPFLIGFILLLLYSSGGSLLSILIGMPNSFIGNDFQLLTNIIVWSFFYIAFSIDSGDSLFGRFYIFCQNLYIMETMVVGNQIRRGLAHLDMFKYLLSKRSIFFVGSWTVFIPSLYSTMLLNFGGILYPYVFFYFEETYIITNNIHNDRKYTTELQIPKIKPLEFQRNYDWKFFYIIILTLICQIFIESQYEVIIDGFIISMFVLFTL